MVSFTTLPHYKGQWAVKSLLSTAALLGEGGGLASTQFVAGHLRLWVSLLYLSISCTPFDHSTKHHDTSA